MLGWFYGHAVSSKEKSRHKRSLRVKLGATDGKCYLTGGEVWSRDPEGCLGFIWVEKRD